MQIGIVGLPNVGKSTLFKALTKKQVNISNYPFCTIEPNVGIVEVPDERLKKLADFSHSQKIIPATIEFVDIAGLVKDAHKGEGLGNKFLARIREVDAIVEVVRDFKDSNIIHVAGKIDPISDMETIKLELIFADLATLEKRLQDLEKDFKKTKKQELEKTILILKKIKTSLEQGKMANELEFDKEERKIIKDFNLLTIKPILFAHNIGESEIKNATTDQDNHLYICAKLEAELADLSPEEAQVMLQELGLKESGLNRLIKKSYALLGLITFLTTGEKETRAWTIHQGDKAPQAAGVIHTDFEKGFIRAEVIFWQDLLKCESEAQAKIKGLIRIEGKDYLMKDGDTCFFRFAV